MPQNEHRKVLLELSEAYDAVYNEGLPAAKPTGSTSVGDEATNWHRQNKKNIPGHWENKPPGATDTQWDAASSTDPKEAFRVAWQNYVEDMHEEREGRWGNERGPVRDDGRPLRPDAEEFGLTEVEAEHIRNRVGIPPPSFQRR